MKIRLLSFLFAAQAAVQTFGAEAKVPKFRPVEIDSKIEIGYGLAIADVNGDKRLDILLADKSEFVWYENPSWKKHVMTGKLTPQDHVCIAASDIDGDGKAEVAVGAGWNPGDTVNSGAVFYLVPPSDRTQKWEAVKLPHEPTVHRMRWVKNGNGKSSLVMVPLHGRGNKDAKGEGIKIISYQVPSDPRSTWQTSAFDTSWHKAHNLDPAQWDNDPAEEVLVASLEGVFLVNKSGQDFQSVQLCQTSDSPTELLGAGEVRHGRLPGGTRFIATVEPMHGNSVVTYTSSTSEKLWKRKVIDESIVDGHAVACGDLTKSGNDQLVVGWRAMNRPGVKVGIKIYVPLDSEGHQWKQEIVDDNTMACEDLTLADLNGDGLLDIVAAGRATKNVKIYFNEGAK